jgi:glutamyl-tRNA synthetase
VALEAYRDEGYLAATMRNYLMLLGWAPSGDREIVPWEVIEAEFRIEDVNPSPAFFDEKKLRAFNGEYIRALSEAEFVAVCQPWLTGTATIPAPPWPADAYDPAAFAAVAPLAQTRIGVLAEIVSYVDFLFLAEPAIDEAAWAKAMKEGSGGAPSGRSGAEPAVKGPRLATGPAELLAATVAAFESSPWNAEALKAALEAVGTERGLKLGKAQAPVRVAVTGRSVGLPLFESLEVLGRERTLARLRAAIDRL